VFPADTSKVEHIRDIVGLQPQRGTGIKIEAGIIDGQKVAHAYGKRIYKPHCSHFFDVFARYSRRWIYLELRTGKRSRATGKRIPIPPDCPVKALKVMLCGGTSM
jgi:hypothetical protein